MLLHIASSQHFEKTFFMYETTYSRSDDQPENGDLASVAINDIDTLEPFFAHTLVPLIVSIFISGGVLIALWWIHPFLALTLLIYLVISQTLPVILIHANSKTTDLMASSQASLNSYLIDSIQGIWETLAFGRELDREAGLLDRANQFNEYQKKFYQRNAIISAVYGILVSLGILSVLWVARSLTIDEGLDPLFIPICITLTVGAFASIGSIVDISQQLSLSFAGANRFFEITEMKPEVQESRSAHLPENFRPDISVEELKFTYDRSGEDVLNGINLQIPAGKTAALVCMTGAGKSTLIHLLLRFWDPYQGRILISGQDIREYPLSHLRDLISIVARMFFCLMKKSGIIFFWENPPQPRMRS